MQADAETRNAHHEEGTKNNQSDASELLGDGVNLDAPICAATAAVPSGDLANKGATSMMGTTDAEAILGKITQGQTS